MLVGCVRNQLFEQCQISKLTHPTPVGKIREITDSRCPIPHYQILHFLHQPQIILPHLRHIFHHSISHIFLNIAHLLPK